MFFYIHYNNYVKSLFWVVVWMLCFFERYDIRTVNFLRIQGFCDVTLSLGEWFLTLPRTVVQFFPVPRATHPTAQCCIPEHTNSHTILVCNVISIYLFHIGWQTLSNWSENHTWMFCLKPVWPLPSFIVWLTVRTHCVRSNSNACDILKYFW